MKRTKNITRTALIALAVLIAAACGSTPAPAPAIADELDKAIREASDYLDSNVPAGNKIVILNVQSDSSALSDYIIDELIANAVNGKNFSVVDRQQLDAIRSELNFQLSGEVDDDSAQAIGKMLGAQTIVSGAISKLGDNYRMRIRALEVQTAQVQGQFNRNIPSGATITALVNSSSKGYSSSQPAARGTQTAAAPAANTPAASGQQPAPIVVEKAPAPAQPAPLKNGTYTFYPRLRAMRGGVDINAYIDRIVVRSGYFTVYLIDRATGKGDDPAGGWYYYDSSGGVILQDLDRPRLTYNPTNSGNDEATGGLYLTFEKVTATRFSLTRNQDKDPPYVFEEIILGNPD